MHADIDDLSAKLSSLREFPVPPGAWTAAQARHANRSAGYPAAPARLAMAASLLVMLAAAVLQAGMPRATATADRAVPAAPPLDGLVAENARLEAVLAGLPQQRTAHMGTAYAVVALEDRLALLDERITTVSLEPSAPEVAEELWRERVSLMNSLVQVQYANLMASR